LLNPFINVCKYLKEGYTENRARLFSEVPSERARDNGQILKRGRFLLNIRNHFFFTVRVTEHWHRFPREAV